MILTSKILMVKPNNFRSNEETIVNNFFQKKSLGISNSVLNKIAIKEFNQFVRKLEDNEIEVVVIGGSRTLNNPDEIFPNNWIVFDQNKIGIFPMFAKNRRTEVNYDLIKKININNNYKIYDYTKYADSEIFLEGTGSFVLDRTDRIAYCSISQRSSKELFLKFCKDFNYNPVSFKAYHTYKNERKLIYHTNIMMTIGASASIICLDSIDSLEERNLVKQKLTETNIVIEISENQVKDFAGNIIILKSKDNVIKFIISETAYNSLSSTQINQINNIGDFVIGSIPNIEKYSGGSVRCMIAEIF
tara:strand:- start:1797 stop:2705 length:909 start_codon:yes stop_codon:yes gene_type:complete